MNVNILMLLVLGYAVVGTLCKNKYFITIPNTLLSEASHNFTAYVSTKTAMVIETVHQVSRISHRSKVIILKKGQQSIPYFVPFIGRHLGSSLELRFIGDKCTATKDCESNTEIKGSFFRTNRQVDLLINNFIIFSETDKPIYKPGDVVRLRSMAVYPTNLMLDPSQLGPYTEILLVNGTYKSISVHRNRAINFDSITIETPENVKMAQWLNVTFEEAMRLSFRLSKDPKFGQWKITTVLGSLKEMTSFIVKKYVLPRFVVDLFPPLVILQSDKNINFKVCAEYSTGKTMEALIRGELCMSTTRRICRSFASNVNGSSKCSDISIDGSPFGLGDKETIYYSTPSQVSVTVTEKGTKHHVKKVAEGSNIKNIPYEITFLSKPYFKRGLPYFGQVRLSRHDGTPQNTTKVVIKVDSSSLDMWGFEQEYTSNDQGLIDFIISYIPIKTQLNLNIYGIQGQSNSTMLAPTLYKTIGNWESVDDEYLQISPPPKKIKCPGSLPMLLLMNGDVSTATIYVQILSRGVISKIIEYPPVPSKCTTRDDYLGHYECIDGNKLKCLKGWTGGNCLAPVCLTGCGRGICVRPDVCMCNSGWSGKLCDKCVVAKYCVNGYCKNGNDCVCLNGWKGYRCETRGPKIHQYEKTKTPLTTAEAPKPEPKYQSQTIFERYIEIPIEKHMGPDLHVLVYYSNHGSEIIADSIELKEGLEECSHLAGGKFDFDTKTANPGEIVKLSIDPGTTKKNCAVRISDIVLSQFGGSGNINLKYLVGKLIKLNHIITTKNDYESDCYVSQNFKLYGSFYSGDVYDSRKVFYRSGVTPISNFRVINIKCRPKVFYLAIPRVEFAYRNNEDTEVLSSPQVVGIPGPKQEVSKRKDAKIKEAEEVKKQIREYFPETWMFDYYNVTPTQLNLTVPDSMTTWKANSYCMTEKGLWFAPSRYLTVVLPFFADIYLPYSIKMGEILQLPVKLFNYVDDCYEIRVTINVEDREILISGPRSFTLCVCSNDVKTIYFNIEAKVIGKVNITIIAQSQYSTFCSNGAKQKNKVKLSDSIRRQLMVEPPGIETETIFSTLICCNNERIGIKGEHNIQSNIVAGSLRSYLVYNGDVMGQTFDNLDRLVKMPYGCGEQNMVALVPSIYVLDYLTNLKINDKVLENKAKGYITDGYQRQLSYKHIDGSYSAFGKHDQSGSTWLTAFVLRSFLDASKYVNIDKGILGESYKYLAKMQLPNGCFKENGRLLSSTMAGGLKNKGETDGALLSAYVLISLQNMKVENHTLDIDRAINCVKSGIDSKSSTYRLALSGYSLSIHDPQSNYMKSLLGQLQNRSISSGRYKYWKSGLDTQGTNGQINSADIETTGYALLALGNVQTIEESLSTIYWLSNQRNSLGGYYSTQDTIVALKSIAVIAEKIGVSKFKQMNLEITLNNNIKQNDTLTASNRLVTRKINVGSDNVTYVSIQANGSGCVNVQLMSLYNIHTTVSAKDEYKVDVKTILTDVRSCTTLEARLCSSYLRKDRNSNMILITIDFPSGWELISSERNDLLKQLIDPLKRIDFMKNKMHLYYDSFSYADEANERCLTFRLEQTSKIDNLKPSLIRMVDYYKPEIYTDIFYSVPSKTCQKTNTTSEGPSKYFLCPRCLNDTPESIYDFQASICPWSFTGIIRSSNNTLQNRVFYESKERVFNEWTVDLAPSNCSCLKSWSHINEDFVVVSSQSIWLTDKLTFTNTSILFPKNVLYRAYRSDLGNSCLAAHNLYRMMTRLDQDFENFTSTNQTCAMCVSFSNLYYRVRNMSELICSNSPRYSLKVISIKHSRVHGILSNDRNLTIFVDAIFPTATCFCLRQLKDFNKTFELMDLGKVILLKNNTADNAVKLVLDHRFKIVDRGIFAQYNWMKCRK